MSKMTFYRRNHEVEAFRCVAKLGVPNLSRHHILFCNSTGKYSWDVIILCANFVTLAQYLLPSQRRLNLSYIYTRYIYK